MPGAFSQNVSKALFNLKVAIRELSFPLCYVTGLHGAASALSTPKITPSMCTDCWVASIVHTEVGNGKYSREIQVSSQNVAVARMTMARNNQVHVASQLNTCWWGQDMSWDQYHRLGAPFNQKLRMVVTWMLQVCAFMSIGASEPISARTISLGYALKNSVSTCTKHSQLYLPPVPH